MPTPIPIIATVDVVASAIVIVLLRIPTMPAAISSPINASPIGKPIARTDPKDRTRMMIAASNPSASLSGIGNSAKTSPPYSIWTVSERRGSVIARISFAMSSNLLNDVCGTSISAKAIA